MAVVTTNLGVVTAYGDAVAAGYTGTKAEWQELMASYATVAEEAAQSATDAETAKNAAVTAKTGAETAKTDAIAAKTAAQTAQTAAETAQGKAETAQEAAEDAAESVSASAAQIATNTSDISDLKEDLTQKANTDGYYADLVSGGSTQLLSDMVATDTTPYNYRTAGGSLEIGDREKLKKIVGGSLAVNQLVTDPNFTDGTKWGSIARAYATVSVSNNEITMTVVETVSANGIVNINSTVPNRAGHKLLFSAYVNPSKSVNVRIGASGSPAAGDYGLDSSPVAASTWTLMEKIGSCQSGNTASSLNFYLDVASALTEGDTVKVKNFVCFDLTAMFGSTIADYIYALEQATAGAGVAWLKARFPKVFDAGYIPYNAGTLEHVSGLSAHKMTGFNQWDEEWLNGYHNPSTGVFVSNANYICSKNLIRVLPSTTYYFNTNGEQWEIYEYDASGNYLRQLRSNIVDSTFVPDADTHFIHIGSHNQTTTYNHDICINLHWDGERDGEYEPYDEHSYPLDSDVTLRGIPKLDANNNLYYDGDEYTPDGAVTRKYGIVDLGTLTWTYSASPNEGFYCDNIGTKIPQTTAHKFVGICPIYEIHSYNEVFAKTYDKSIAVRTNGGLRIYDSAYTDATAFKTAMSGVYLVYELETPTTESADPYTEIQNVSNWGTEEFVTTSLVPVGHETAYQPDLRAKIEVAPESPDTDGLYLMKRENGENSYVAYLGELPSDPSEDGTYTLKCTVSSGTATKTWEADT